MIFFNSTNIIKAAIPNITDATPTFGKNNNKTIPTNIDIAIPAIDKSPLTNTLLPPSSFLDKADIFSFFINIKIIRYATISIIEVLSKVIKKFFAPPFFWVLITSIVAPSTFRFGLEVVILNSPPTLEFSATLTSSALTLTWPTTSLFKLNLFATPTTLPSTLEFILSTGA